MPTARLTELLLRLFLGIIGILTVTSLVLFATTPFLNYDDVVYNTAYFDGWQLLPKWDVLWALFINSDVGAVETRTYGLARIIQYHEIMLFGPSPRATYTFLIAVHLLSAGTLYWAIKKVVIDDVARVFIAIVWFANPFVLLISHTLHHHLYLIGPYYFVILWIGVTLNHPRANWSVGAALLTCAWLMGETVTPVIIALLTLSAFDPQRRPSIVRQALCVAVLFIAYVSYQRYAIYDPTLARWAFAAPTTLSVIFERLRLFSVNFYNIAIGSLGFEYIEGAPNSPTAPIGLWSSWSFWVPCAILLILAPFLKESISAHSDSPPAGRHVGSIRGSYLLFSAAIAASACGLYFVSFLATAGQTDCCVRHSFALTLACARLANAGRSHHQRI